MHLKNFILNYNGNKYNETKKYLLKDGTYAYMNRNQPAYYAYRILW